jgi:hypothetical protein
MGETRGVRGPGEEHSSGPPWRGFGWLVALWVLGVALFVFFFAAAT